MNISIGILAHVDAGKTTLSESILFNTQAIRSMGRVDKKNAFLDTDQMERERGITIFSKQAMFNLTEDIRVTLLDTPGHVDFSPEAERTLWVLDMAILVVSGADSVQGHTKTLFSLLKKHEIPTFIFVNKMDQPLSDASVIMRDLKHQLSDMCVDFSETASDAFFEEVAMADEEIMERYLEAGVVSEAEIRSLISQQKVYPVFFGSALKNEGVTELLEGMAAYLPDTQSGLHNSEEPSGRIYKITRDAEGNRLTHIKITAGRLCNRQLLCDDEKITGIRVYSGEKYETVTETQVGGIYALTGLTKTYGGQGIGAEEDAASPTMEPVMTYKLILPPEIDPAQMMKRLNELCEDMPELHAVWDEELSEIHVSIMGRVQLEILTRIIHDRFDIDVTFGRGRIVYKETISNIVEGVGHFEPLRHYAEAHLKLEPGERGSGVQAFSDVSTDELALNWQRLIMTHILERTHRGVLTGSALTDIKITVVGGRAHPKHTMGGDFRQATYRGIRQGLMQAQSVLLEPYYDFILEVPDAYVGKAMTDLDMRGVKFSGPVPDGNGITTITGYGSVAVLQDYPAEVMAYSGGRGRLSVTYRGYEVCHNAQEVILNRGYDPEADIRNSPDSVFCAHGAGYPVPWHEVFEYMHIPPCLSFNGDGSVTTVQVDNAAELEMAAIRARSESLESKSRREGAFMGYEEVDAIVARAASSNVKAEKRENVPGWKRIKRDTGNPTTAKVKRVYNQPDRDKYMLVDGYNVIHAWKELSELAGDNLDGARGRLLDILCNYQGMVKTELIAVFDAYRVKGHTREIEDYHNIHVVYTKEAETADAYIEKFTHENGKKYDITVVTSDGLEQVIIMGNGCSLLSSREFELEVKRLNEEIREGHMDISENTGNKLMDNLSEESKRVLLGSTKADDQES